MPCASSDGAPISAAASRKLQQENGKERMGIDSIGEPRKYENDNEETSGAQAVHGMSQYCFVSFESSS